MASIGKCAFVRGCLRQNLPDMLRTEAERVLALDELLDKAISMLALKSGQKIVPERVVHSLSVILSQMVIPEVYEFFSVTDDDARLNRFGFVRKPAGVGMVPILIYSTSAFAVEHLIIEALSCYNVIHKQKAN